MTGKVKYWLEAKGWGFITIDDGSDVFVHYRDIDGDGRRNLLENQKVSFAIKQTAKGPRAMGVKVVDIPSKAEA